jgi:hypothetical protein
MRKPAILAAVAPLSQKRPFVRLIQPLRLGSRRADVFSPQGDILCQIEKQPSKVRPL